jgi:hypothetical protein
MIPIEVLMVKCFDGEFEFNGDALEVLEDRHDSANLRLTNGVFRFVLFGFAPEMIMHSRCQGWNCPWKV